MSGENLQKGGANWTANNSMLELGAGNYKLESNITTVNTILITGDVTFDLNGYGISIKQTWRIKRSYVRKRLSESPDLESYVK